VLVRAFLCEPRDLLGAALLVALIAKLATVGPQAITKLSLVGVESDPRLVMMNRKLLKRVAGALLGCPSGFADCALKLFAKFALESLHGRGPAT
jgi:hypothetical protein